MNYKSLMLLVGFAAAALPALATPEAPELRGSLDVDAARGEIEGDDGWIYGGSGQVMVLMPNWGIGAQAGGGYQRIDLGFANGQLWNASGHLFWRGGYGALGASFQYAALDIKGLQADSRMVGLFGEYYALPYLTVRLKGGYLNGGVNIAADNGDGGYVGFNAENYFLPDFGVAAEVEHAALSGLHTTAVGGYGEYLISRHFPLSVRAGYRHIFMTGNLDMSVVWFGLRYRFGQDGSLVMQDRGGPVLWNGLADLKTLEL